MKLYFSHQTKILLFAIMVIATLLVVIIWQEYPFGVKKYKTVTLGMQATEITGSFTGWAPPDDYIPDNTEFFVYSLGEESMCVKSDCGMGGYFIECLGGWISGYKAVGDVPDYGLGVAGMNIDKEKIITIADKTGKIVGIYPGASIKNLPYIMRNHRNLVSTDAFNGCSSQLPRWWK